MACKTYRSTLILPAAEAAAIAVQDTLLLTHDERHVRRKLLHFENGDMIMLDYA